MATANRFSSIIKYLSVERLFFLVFILALLLRFLFLDLKLLHHDEAIHAWFSYELLTRGRYIYDPSYHGPLLYYLTSGMFSLFGDSDLVARILPALFGALIVPLVYFIYKLGYLDHRQALIAALFIAISPDMVYFSRFLRHDIFQLFFVMLLVVGLLWYLNKGKLRYLLIAALAVAGGMTLKEDMPIFLIIFGIFGLYLLWSKRITLPVSWKRDVLICSLIAVGIISLFYSSFGAHPEVLFPADISQGFNQTGWYKAIEHWTGMHSQCRICGPWFFYILLFILYELPILILAIFAIVQYGVDKRTRREWSDRLKSLFRVRPPPLSTEDLVRVSIRQLGEDVVKDNRRDFFEFSLFWMALSIVAYAYIGEKVPWLILHQLLPMIFVAVYLMTNRKAAVAIGMSAFLIIMTLHVAFDPGDINEPIVQVQNSEDMRTVMALIDASNSTVVASKNYWPLPWYYRGDRWNKMRFYGQIVDTGTIYSLQPDIVITHDQDSFVSLDGYNKSTYKLAYWFSYYDNQDRLLQWYLYRDGKMGSINIDVFTRNNWTSKLGSAIS